MCDMIITHPGNAHMDDFLSCCFALAIHGEETIYRREPTVEDLEDPDTLVLDVGMFYQPDLNNFDHHQRGTDEQEECALSLFAEEREFEGYKLTELLNQYKWFETTILMDVDGPTKASALLGFDPGDKPWQVFSNPVGTALLSLFSQETEIHYSDPLNKMMANIGYEILYNAVMLSKRMSELQLRVRIVHAAQSGFGAEGVLLDDTDITGLDKWVEKTGKNILFSLTRDNRGEGWTLYRYNDAPEIDFSILEGREEILFAAKSGFIAKTKRDMPQKDLLDLVKDSFTGDYIPF